MNREIHVRFWEGLGVRFPRATHCAQKRETWKLHARHCVAPAWPLQEQSRYSASAALTKVFAWRSAPCTTLRGRFGFVSFGSDSHHRRLKREGASHCRPQAASLSLWSGIRSCA